MKSELSPPMNTAMVQGSVSHMFALATLTVVAFTTDVDAAGAVWRQIEAVAGGGLAVSWDWVATWLHHFGSLVPFQFAIGEGPDGPCGVALVTQGIEQRRGPFPVRTVHLGTAGEPPGHSVCVEFNRVLALPGQRDAFATALLAALQGRGFSWQVLELNGFDAKHAEPFLRAEPRFIVTPFPAYGVDLCAMRDAGQPVLAVLPRSTAAKIRKDLRRFQERYGPVRVEWAETVAEGLAILHQMIPLHQERWRRAGQPGVFSSPRFTAFHHDLIARLMPQGKIVLFRAYAGDQLLGIFYGLVDGGMIQHYQWGLPHFEDRALAPGYVVAALCMEEALRRGYDEINWLKGEVRYKRELSTMRRELVWAELHRGPWLAAIDALHRARAWQRAHWSPRGRAGKAAPCPSTG